MLFVGPLTSKVYLVALLWPVVAVGVVAWDHAAVRRALIVVAILSSALPLLPGRTMQRLLLGRGHGLLCKHRDSRISRVHAHALEPFH
jgi:hypothetical protein